MNADALALPLLIGRCVSCVGAWGVHVYIGRWVVKIPGGTKITGGELEKVQKEISPSSEDLLLRTRRPFLSDFAIAFSLA